MGVGTVTPWEKPLCGSAEEKLRDERPDLFETYCTIIKYARGGNPLVLGQSEIVQFRLQVESVLEDSFKLIQHKLDRALLRCFEFEA